MTALRSLERIRRETDAATAVLVAALPDDRDGVTRLARGTGISSREARRRRGLAVVVNAVPEARTLLASGAVTSEHITALRPVIHMPAVGDLAQAAIGLSPEAFAAEVQQFRLAHEHGSDTVARQRALRRLTFFAGPEGTIGFNGLLPPLEGAALKTRLQTVVDSRWKAEHPERARGLGGHGGDTREQRTADALLELIGVTGADVESRAITSGAITSGTITSGTITSGAITSGAARPHPTQNRSSVTSAKPATVVVFDIDRYQAELLDHGPVPVTDSLFDQTRASLYVLFTDGRGEVLKFARARRDPSLAQRLAVMARDRRCVYPDCQAPPSECSIHHFNEWLRDHGYTDVEVLGLLCDPHHRHLHLKNLKATREADGSVTIRDRATRVVIARASPCQVAA